MSTTRTGTITITESEIKTQNGDIIIGGVKITNVFDSLDYKQLQDQIDDWSSMLHSLDEAQKDKSILIQRRLANLIQKRSDFVQKVSEVAKLVAKIGNDSERLRFANEYFKSGDYGKVDELLSPRQLFKDQSELSKLKSSIQDSDYENDRKLKSNSNEFLLRAQITRLKFDSKNRLDDVCLYFEAALESYATLNTRMYYIEFLIENELYDEAKRQFDFLKEEDYSDQDRTHRALIEGNLGILFINDKKYFKAEKIFRSISGIFKEEMISAPHDFNYIRYQYLGSLNNLATTCFYLGKTDEGIGYLVDALNEFNRIEIVKSNPLYYQYYLGYANALNNVGNIYFNDSEQFDRGVMFIKMSLENFTIAAEGNPIVFNQIAKIEHTLAVKLNENGNYSEAVVYFEKCLKFTRFSMEKRNTTIVNIHLSCLYNYSGCLVELGKFEKSIPIFRESMLANMYYKEKRVFDLYENNTLETILREDITDLIKGLNGIVRFYEKGRNKKILNFFAMKSLVACARAIHSKGDSFNWNLLEYPSSVIDSFKEEE